MGQPFGFMGFLGVASLVGVIVSHVIVLFDFIEEAHERGEPLREALLDAGIVRLGPVMITGRRDCAWTRTTRHARWAALGAPVLCANRRPHNCNVCHAAPCPGALLDLCVGPKTDSLGNRSSGRV